ncbi:ketopantoate reductase family protein [Streptomyces fuscigenes]|uniref:ketopantoate reductase family protein n=1 Tax=Streptomyces fuscigenes TaxID=1528880 RepID=UPI001F47C979|nr:2-dehydropantoate 2-reductase N-terminal domain-containing protein [Streptomyces fuscigenes]MCF3961320.1 ketopantoate reductase family protein [Streptomyces fuscigenes]
MRYIIIGAGAVGGSIGGRLAEAGTDVVLVARGAHYEALRDHGLTFTTPDGTHTRRIPVVDRPEDVELGPDDVLLLAVKTQDSLAALTAWSRRPVRGGGTAGERLPLVCAQNGVESERLALRRFRHVYAMCVWLPSSHVEPGAVLAPSAPFTGILHLGRYPSGTDETARAVGGDLEKARLLAPVVPDAMRWKYAKLLSNLANAIEAVSGLTEEDARVVHRRALAEGWAVLAAAGADCATQEEQDEARSLIHFDAATGAARGGGSSWQSLARGAGTIETDYLNGEIVLLGRMHGVATPVNETLQLLADTFAAERRPAASLPASQLRARVEEAVAAGQAGTGPA